jgi:hypothetical protein
MGDFGKEGIMARGKWLRGKWRGENGEGKMARGKWRGENGEGVME